MEGSIIEPPLSKIDPITISCIFRTVKHHLPSLEQTVSLSALTWPHLTHRLMVRPDTVWSRVNSIACATFQAQMCYCVWCSFEFWPVLHVHLSNLLLGFHLILQVCQLVAYYAIHSQICTNSCSSTVQARKTANSCCRALTAQLTWQHEFLYPVVGVQS